MKPYFQVLIWLAIGIVIGLVVFLFIRSAPVQTSVNTSPNLTIDVNNQSQQLTPPKKSSVNLTLIVAPCKECNYGEIAIEQTKIILLNSSNLSLDSVRNIDYPSAEASMLIAKYNITELPVILITGNASSDTSFVSLWEENVGTQESDGSLISRYLYPPFYDLKKNRVSGLVSIIIIEADCAICVNANNFTVPLESELFGVVFANKTILNESDELAQDIIEKYHIEKLPAVLFNEEFFVYPVGEQFVPFGTVGQDGWFVLRDVWPPYVELPDHTLRGQVSAIYITNNSCSDCFDIHGLSLYISDSVGFTVYNETYYDITSSEAVSLISKYNLTNTPALIYSPEASVYRSFEEMWMYENNTVEDDGWFVFRAYQFVVGNYQTIN